jgi:hypothetical protein
MAPHIYSKASGDVTMGGGGMGSHTHSAAYNITRPTRREKKYASDMAIYLRHKIPCTPNDNLILDVGKDRNGNAGVKELPEAIDAIADLLSRYKFQDGNQMFQTSLKLRLSEVMKDVLLGDDVIPTQNAITEYVEGGKNE